jgi:DNA-binding MarR family transcriptional regulator
MVGLAEVTEAEAKVIADVVEISLSTMSNQMSALAQAGYVTIRKGYVGKRPRTWLALTPTGRQRLATHLDALREIAKQHR